MAEEAPWTDYFNLFESYIDSTEITDTSIRISMRKVGVFSGFQGHTLPYTFYEACTLVYEDVQSSVRVIREFTDLNRKSLKNFRYSQIDAPFKPTSSKGYLHIIDSISNELNAWIHWEIVAALLDIEVNNSE